MSRKPLHSPPTLRKCQMLLLCIHSTMVACTDDAHTCVGVEHSTTRIEIKEMCVMSWL